MLVLVKNGPETTEGRRGVKTARDLAADIVFLQNGVYFAFDEELEGFCGTAYALEEDLVLRGIGSAEVKRGLKIIDWDELVDLMALEDKVAGAF